MSTYFVDTSALAKRYIVEIGFRWVRSWILPSADNIIVLSNISTIEMISVLMRREREGTISQSDRIQAQNNFLHHVENQYLMVDLDSDVLEEARNVLLRHPLRTLDALQLASALDAARALRISPTFVSADTRLLSVAAAEGFAVDDPNTHP